MSGRDFLTSQAHRQTIQGCKLQTAVARDARDWRLAVEVTGDKRLHDSTLEVAFEIQHVKRKAELLGDASRVVNVVQRTATRGKRVAVLIDVDAPALIPELHRKADEFVTLLL